MAIGAYPGSFDPPTVAHLAVAEAAHRRCGLERVDLILSRRPLGKGQARAGLADREAVLREVASSRRWLGVRVSEGQLLAELAAGYDVLVLGADKWRQILDPAWYGGSVAARDEMLAGLPPVAVARRPAHGPVLPLRDPPGGVLLDMAAGHHEVSSSAVRAGRREWMLDEAAEMDRRTGIWSGSPGDESR